jgi:hypothetical protein
MNEKVAGGQTARLARDFLFAKQTRQFSLAGFSLNC